MIYIFVLVISLIFALLEIQIEGEEGWAKNLPTWKIPNPFKNHLAWPHITGYHIYLFSIIFLLLHYPYVQGIPFSWITEVKYIQTFIAVIMVEDFFWFIFNPKWGIKRFFTDTIEWMPKRFLKFPISYWTGLLILILLQLFRQFQ